MSGRGERAAQRGRIAPAALAIAAISCNAIFGIDEGSPKVDGAGGEPAAGGSPSAGAPDAGGSSGSVGQGGSVDQGNGGKGGANEGAAGEGRAGEGGAGGTDQPNVCGDGGGPAGNESCDDGNDHSGDGCSSTCQLEAIAVAGRLHTCAVLGNGRVKCWGPNANGELGLGDRDWRGDVEGQMGDNLPFVDLGTTISVHSLALGNFHSCALFANGRVKCWGLNNTGQLGAGDDENRGDQQGEMGTNLPWLDLGTDQFAKAIAAAANHTCAILADDRLKCWGLNAGGSLGAGHDRIIGDDPGEMGDALLPIDLGSERTALAVALGVGHTCAVLDNGDVKCWGQNDYGMLGLGDAEERGNEAGEMGDDLDPVDLGAPALGIAAGSFHTCALLQGGIVKCWGLNNEGQLGLGDTETRGDAPGEMGESLPAVQLGASGATELTAGTYHNCVRFDVRTVKCWGTNASGQLGLESTLGRGIDVSLMGANLPFVNLGTGELIEQLSSGGGKNCAVLASGKLKCWGGSGLGIGDPAPRGDGAGEMGENLPAIVLVGEE